MGDPMTQEKRNSFIAFQTHCKVSYYLTPMITLDNKKKRFYLQTFVLHFWALLCDIFATLHHITGADAPKTLSKLYRR